MIEDKLRERATATQTEGWQGAQLFQLSCSSAQPGYSCHPRLEHSLLSAGGSLRPFSMGCSGSKGGSLPLAPGMGEEQRKGVPVRVEVPEGAGWRACTVGKSLGVIDGSFEVRVDNGGGKIAVVLKRPAALNTFAAFEEYMEGNESLNDDDNAFEAFSKMLPLQPGQPVNINLLLEEKWVVGRIAETRSYYGGERVLLLLDDQLVDATVDGLPLNCGAMHSLTISSAGPGGKPRQVKADLNDFNHCQQLFTSAAAYEEARVAYLDQLVSKLSYVQDAITGKQLNIDDQVSPPRAHAVYLSVSFTAPVPSPHISNHLPMPLSLPRSSRRAARIHHDRRDGGQGQLVLHLKHGGTRRASPCALSVAQPRYA